MARIEDKLKVKKFTHEWHKATVNIVYTSNWINFLLEQRANQHNLTLQQFNVLRILRGQYPNPTKNILLRERMLSKTVDISRLVDRVVAKGLVSRKSSATDKRAVDLLITDKGLALLEKMEEEMMLTDVLPGNITEKQCEQLSKLLDRFRGDD